MVGMVTEMVCSGRDGGRDGIGRDGMQWQGWW